MHWGQWVKRYDQPVSARLCRIMGLRKCACASSDMCDLILSQHVVAGSEGQPKFGMRQDELMDWYLKDAEARCV